MSDTLIIGGTTYNNVAGFKATDSSDNELFYVRPTGTKEITENGTGIDVKNFASVNVNVSSGESNLQSKTVSPTTSQQTISPDSGYDGLSSVTVNAMPSGSASTPTTTIMANPSISVSSSGLITASVSGSQSVMPSVSAGYVSSGTAGTVSVSGSNTEQLTTMAAQSITPTTSQQTVSTSGKYMTGNVTVNAIPPEYVIPSGNLPISQNGTGIDVSSYATVSVAVPSPSFVTYYTGSSTPSSSLGSDGDIYLQT